MPKCCWSRRPKHSTYVLKPTLNPKPSTQNPQPQNQVSAEERGSSRAESRRGTCDSAIAWMITAFNSIRVASRVDWDNMWMAGAGYW